MRQPLGYIPLTLSKSINESGDVEYKMRGKMSSSSKDDDGQYLNPSGFDMTDFMGPGGFINWHHQQNKNPLAIIGKPTDYQLDRDKNEMWIDFKLFGNNPMAQQVWKLQEVLEEQGLGLGLSLEGSVTEVKDPNTGEIYKSSEAKEKNIPFIYVEGAKVTGCAVTPGAKNKDTVVELVKGNEDFSLIKSDIVSEGSGGEVGEGRHPLALESLEEELKTLEFDSELGLFKTNKRELPKEYHTRGRAQEFLEKCYDDSSSKLLSKSQVFAVLGKFLPLDTKNFEEIFNFTVNLEKGNNLKKMETVTEQKVSPEKLKEALQELEVLSKGTETQKIESPTVDETKAEEVEAVSKRLEVLEKGMTTLIGLHKEILSKANFEKEDLSKGDGEEEEKEEEKEDEEEEIEKAGEETEGGKEEKLEKGKLTDSPVDLIKGFVSEQKSQFSSFMEQTSELIKGQNEVIEGLKETIEDISKESAGRKTVTTRNFLRKGNHELETDLNSLSASADKREILDILTPKVFGDSGIKDENLSKAVLQFEQGNIVTNTLIKGLKDAGYTLIQ